MRHVLPCLALPLLLAACGGSSGEPAPVPPVPLGPIQDAQAAFIEAPSGFVYAAGGASLNSTPGVGDNALDEAFRGYLVYDLASVPPGAAIVSATLHARQTPPIGDPFPAFGVVDVDHVNDRSYADATLTTDVGTLAPDGTAGARTLDVTAQVAADVAASRTTSQFRLRFSAVETDNDGAQDTVFFSRDSRIEIQYR